MLPCVTSPSRSQCPPCVRAYRQRDLATFQRNNLLPLQPVTTVIGGGDVDSVCASNANNCVEVRPSPVYQLSEPIH